MIYMQLSSYLLVVLKLENEGDEMCAWLVACLARPVAAAAAATIKALCFVSFLVPRLVLWRQRVKNSKEISEIVCVFAV